MNCDCEFADQCKIERVRDVGGRLFKICRGTSGLSPEKQAQYVAKWSGEEYQPPSRSTKPKCVQCPGTELSVLLKAKGYSTTGGCGCKAKIRKMDSWGPTQCRAKIDEVVDWLVEAASKKGWATKLAAKLPLSGHVVRFKIKQLVMQAIEIAEGKGVYEFNPKILAVYNTPQEDPEERFTITIKSILRWDCVERLVRSIKRWYPTVQILIADDSFETLPAELPEAVQRTIQIPGVTWYQIEYDYGLSAARSFLTERAKTEYIINCDDDFVFTEETKVHLLADVLDSDEEVDVIAGLVRMDGRTAQVWNGHFRYDEDSRVLSMETLTSPWRMRQGVWYRRTDLSWNFFCANREVLLKNPRDPEYKICGEHLDQYLGWKRDGVRCFESPSVIIGHLEVKPPEYEKMRRRTKQFYGRLMEKWRMSKPLDHPPTPVPGIEMRDVQQMLRDQDRERPNIVLLTVGHTGSSVVSSMLGALGWNMGDADDEYSESISVRHANQRQDWSQAARILSELPEPWAIKDPRFCEFLDRWKPAMEPYAPVLVWLTRDPDDVRDSFERRGESLELLGRRMIAAERHFANWTGPKLRLDYSQVMAAAALFQPRETMSLGRERFCG